MPESIAFLCSVFGCWMSRSYRLHRRRKSIGMRPEDYCVRSLSTRQRAGSARNHIRLVYISATVLCAVCRRRAAADCPPRAIRDGTKRRKSMTSDVSAREHAFRLIGEPSGVPTDNASARAQRKRCASVHRTRGGGKQKSKTSRRLIHNVIIERIWKYFVRFLFSFSNTLSRSETILFNFYCSLTSSACDNLR